MSWQHLRDTEPVGQKDYKCFLCGLVILKGEKHTVRAGVSDGEFNTFRMHTICEMVSRDWRQEDWEVDIDFKEFRSELLAFGAPQDALIRKEG